MCCGIASFEARIRAGGRAWTAPERADSRTITESGRDVVIGAPPRDRTGPPRPRLHSGAAAGRPEDGDQAESSRRAGLPAAARVSGGTARRCVFAPAASTAGDPRDEAVRDRPPGKEGPTARGPAADVNLNIYGERLARMTAQALTPHSLRRPGESPEKTECVVRRRSSLRSASPGGESTRLHAPPGHGPSRTLPDPSISPPRQAQPVAHTTRRDRQLRTGAGARTAPPSRAGRPAPWSHPARRVLVIDINAREVTIS